MMALAPAGMTKEAALLQYNSVPDAGEELKALGHDDHPNVGNLIGYSYRPSRRRALLNVSSRKGDK